MLYAVLLLKTLTFAVEASTRDEACASAIAVALGEASERVKAQVTFGGKRVRVQSCVERKQLDTGESGG